MSKHNQSAKWSMRRTKMIDGWGFRVVIRARIQVLKLSSLQLLHCEINARVFQYAVSPKTWPPKVIIHTVFCTKLSLLTMSFFRLAVVSRRRWKADQTEGRSEISGAV